MSDRGNYVICLYCGKDGVECSDEEIRCKEHLLDWQYFPDGDEYV